MWFNMSSVGEISNKSNSKLMIDFFLNSTKADIKPQMDFRVTHLNY